MSLPALPTFRSFFHEAYGHDPYPWQARLADEVVARGAWPDTIGVPTGTGKTATLDVAIYAMAAEADRPASKRRAPRRVVMVVDRRTIVDQSFARAQLLQRQLSSATGGALAAIRERLRALMGGDTDREEPMQVALLRGGIPRDDGWARRPDQALIALSTVDQVGSRLLFRGYGVRPTMRSVHAGLLGHDTLLLLDEVHLSKPFEETLSALSNRWRGWREQGLVDRWQVVALSATSGSDEIFDLSADDLQNARLRKRLRASKPLTLQEPGCATHNKSGPHPKWVKAFVEQVGALLKSTSSDEPGCGSVGVVLNRVDTARAVAAELQAKLTADVLLVTGRMRASDRAVVTAELERRAGPAWGRNDRPFICVATQCIEAGADLDFDGLVTEAASLDALVQRFGRANRTGDHDHAPITVLAPKGIDDLDDPIYARSTGPAFRWLQQLGEGFDVSTEALREALPSAPPEAFVEKAGAAVLLPAHLDLLAQTNPGPEPDPDPALYLHGVAPPRAEVTIVWRADVKLGRLDKLTERVGNRLEAVPPSSYEGISLPYAAVKRWLAGEAITSFGDAVDTFDDAENVGRRRPRPVGWRWNGTKAESVIAGRIRPGDTLVLPSTRGGIRDGNFDPAADAPVVDVGDLACTLRTGKPVARLDLDVYGILVDKDSDDGTPPDGSPHERAWPADVPAPPTPPTEKELETTTVQQAAKAVHAWLRELPAPGEDPSPLARQLALVRRCKPRVSYIEGRWVLFGRERLDKRVLLELARGAATLPSDDARTGGDESVVSSGQVPLSVHLAGVGRWARDLASACGLPTKVVEDLELAGRLHDLGKADERFQAYLHGGDMISALAAPEPIAKSGEQLRDRTSRGRAHERSGLPKGFRHEMMSVALLLGSDQGRTLLGQAHDADLVLHLVASHHGHARPFAPPEVPRDTEPPSPVEVAVDGVTLRAEGDPHLDAPDSGVADRFWQLQRRYGWWGLAWLEAVLRLADHRESEAEERQAVNEEEA